MRDTLVIQCEQKKGAKCVPTEEILGHSNSVGFGDNIGKITNRITAMTELQSMFPHDSEEYKRLDYRIQAGQKFQQDEID